MDIHIYIHNDADGRILGALAGVQTSINALSKQGKTIMLDLTNLTAAAEANSAADTSIEALCTSIAAQLTSSAGDQAAIQAIADHLNQNAADIAANVLTNTPAAPVTGAKRRK